MSDDGCLWSLSTHPVKKRVTGDGLKREQVPVPVSAGNFSHNHHLTKGLLIKANMSTYKYAITPEVANSIVKMLNSSPLLTSTMRNFLQDNVYPDTMRITSTTVINIKTRVHTSSGKQIL